MVASSKTAASEKKSHPAFFKIGLSVDCVIFGYLAGELKVLVIQSDLAEFATQWSLIGELVRPDEDLDEAPYRILENRTGIRNIDLEQVYTFGKRDRHPSGRVVTVAYYALVDTTNFNLPKNEGSLCWRSVRSLKKMAFDHRKILDICLSQLREQVFERPLLFELLPAKFTLRDLQILYESVLGMPLDRRNFRKKIAVKNWLRDTGEMEKGVDHRPGHLYVLKSPKSSQKLG